MAKWNRDQTLLLIELYQQHNVLYNEKNKDYLNRRLRDISYKKILKEMIYVKPNINGADLKAKIRVLRGQYTREKHKIKADRNYRPKLWCYYQLGFLDSCYEAGEDGVEEEEEVEESNMSFEEVNIKAEDTSVTTQENHFEPQDNNSSDIDSENSFEKINLRKEALNALDLAKQLAAEHKSKDSGSEGSFCNFLCYELKKIKSAQRVDELQWEILDLVREAVKTEREEDIKNKPSTSASMPSATVRAFPLGTKVKIQNMDLLKGVRYIQSPSFTQSQTSSPHDSSMHSSRQAIIKRWPISIATTAARPSNGDTRKNISQIAIDNDFEEE